MNRQEKGITLIALVITILILVILVGVSVTAAINTGLIQNSKNAVANYSEKQKQEEDYLDNVAKMMEIYSMEEVKAGEYTGTSNKKYVDNGKTAYIPAGFTVSNVEGETSIDKGLVIYSGNHSAVEDMTTVQTRANQYVWIPVENPSDMYGTFENGNKYGKLYDFGNSTNGYATSPEDATHLNWYDEVGTEVTDEEVQQAQGEYDTQYNQMASEFGAALDSMTSEELAAGMESMKAQGFTGSTKDELIDFIIKQELGDRPTEEYLKKAEYYEGYREPVYLKSDGSQYNVDANGNKIITKKGIQDEFDKMINSVETYKGFYIGRYELTGNTSFPTVVKGATPLTAGTRYGDSYLRWYGLYSMCEKLEEGNNDAKGKVTTTMVWGSQWDQAIKKSLTDKSDIFTNKNLYYKPDSSVTGDAKSAYNIFGMTGSRPEWTLESLGDKFRTDHMYDRSANYSSDYFPGSSEEQDFWCRPQLYL